jgi:hypothetical protein
VYLWEFYNALRVSSIQLNDRTNILIVSLLAGYWGVDRLFYWWYWNWKTFSLWNIWDMIYRGFIFNNERKWRKKYRNFNDAYMIMIQNRNKLYLLLVSTCILNYTWLYYKCLKNNFYSEITACYFKKATTLPSSSCGFARTVMTIFRGNFVTVFLINLVGFVVFATMTILPLWILFDNFLKKILFLISI